MIKALKIITSMPFDLVLANNTILSCSFFFLNYWLIFNYFSNYWIIDLYFIIPIAKIFNPIAELVIPRGIPSKESKSEIEIYPVIVEAKIRKC